MILRIFKFMPLIFLLVFLGAGESHAGYDYKFESQEPKMGQFESEIGGKLQRGTTNLLYGWTELMRTPVQMSQGPEHRLATALVVGIPYGILRAVGRTGIGIYEMMTCFAPQPPIMAPIEGNVA